MDVGTTIYMMFECTTLVGYGHGTLSMRSSTSVLVFLPSGLKST